MWADHISEYASSEPVAEKYYTVHQQMLSWQKSGYPFTVDLAKTFLDQDFSVDPITGYGDVGDRFQKYAPSIKNSELYRNAAQNFFTQRAKDNYVPGTTRTVILNVDVDPQSRTNRAFEFNYFTHPYIYELIGLMTTDIGLALGVLHKVSSHSFSQTGTGLVS
jgi:hypothetical protein